MTQYITPTVMCIIIFTCFYKRVPLYEAVTEGAGEGIFIVLRILPALIAILCAVYMMNESGVLDYIISILSPITEFFNIPSEVMPMALLRPISGSGALGMLSDSLMRYGADSRSGMISSIIMGSTETTFYIIAVYFGATGVKKPSRVIPCAIIGDVVGVLTAVMLVK